MTPEELYQRISKKNELLLLDVRNPQDFQAARLEARHTPETLHIPYYEFIEEEDNALKRVPQGREIIALCNKGNSSAYVADILKKRHIQACNLEGGMEAWGNLYVTHTLSEAIIQVDRPARGCLSYILINQGEAAVIDPGRHIAYYRKILSSRNASLKAVFDTHAHADHISGGPALAQAENVPYYLHPYDGIHPTDMIPAKLRYEMLSDGFTYPLGNLTLTALHIPGHTLGQVGFLVQDYFICGDSLFIQSFGRPDLGGQGQAWAPLVAKTLFETIPSRVSENALVLPAHYASQQEANDAGAFAMSLKDLFKQNKDLQIPKQDFLPYMLGHLPTFPPQYLEIKRVNLGLSQANEQQASELEMGKNICALSSVYDKQL